MAEAEVQLNGGASNGIDENQPPAENHIKEVTSHGDAVAEKSKERSSDSKHKSSSHKSSHGDKHRSSGSHKSSHGDKHRSSSSHKSSHGDKHRSSSSKSSHKDKDRDKERSSSSKHSSSSSSKHHSSSSSSSKHHSSSSKHGSSSSSKHGSSSSSKHGSSSGSRHKSSSHDKHRSSSSGKDKHSDKERKEEQPKPVIKEEPKEEVSPVKEENPPSPEPVKEEVMKVEPMEEDGSDDDVPLSARKKPASIYKEDSDFEPDEKPASKKRKSMAEEDDDDFSPERKKKKPNKVKKEVKTPPAPKAKKNAAPSPVKGKKKGAENGEQTEKWKWWEEDTQRTDGRKWNFLEHKGPVFAPPYERLPASVRFYYDGEEMQLSEAAEEVAGFYARMLDHDYTTRDVFNNNFMKDWKKVMTSHERSVITNLKKCNFREMDLYFKKVSEEKKNKTKEQKKQLKEENAALVEEYGWCTMDGHKEKIGNFRIEPPGLFRGRGEHPKQGMLKTRTMPEDIIINCSRDSQIPKAPDGHKWKEVRHDNTVTWLASWNENIQGSTKYIMLAPTSKLKGAKDWQKYETARRLHTVVDKIRAQYHEDFKSKEMRIRQRAVALYFIDKLALRAGNEKDGEETADTVGCCSLRVEHITLYEEKNGKEYVVEFDFLGKDSIRYFNSVQVEKRVFKNLQLFKENKQEGDDLFDRLNTATMNKHLNTLMDGLTAKVFRTYNASRTLQEQLNIMTNEDDSVAAKMLSYNRANRAVAVLCNHQRAAPKNFSKQMENLQNKIDAKRDAVRAAKKEVKQAKADFKALKTAKAKTTIEKKKKTVERLEEQLMKLEVQATDKDENKEIALGTSKLNYLDPRISVAWCKKFDVPLEKVYNRTQRDKFAWAIDMTEEDYDFMTMEEGD